MVVEHPFRIYLPQNTKLEQKKFKTRTVKKHLHDSIDSKEA
jgi:hypothetical protein